MKKSFREKLDTYLLNAQVAPDHPFIAMKKFEFASGVVAIYDTSSRWKVFFDRVRWRPKRPEYWIYHEVLFPQELVGTGIGTLPGDRELPAIGNEEEMLSLAKRELTSSQPINWHARPLAIV